MNTKSWSNLVALCLLAACGDPKDAEPCTVEPTVDGASIECPDGSTVGIRNGADGQDGSHGVDGTDGADGVDGADGTDNHIAASHFCTAQLDTAPLWFVYQVAVMASGDVFAYGGIRGASAEYGATAYYAATQNGAATAAVFFTADSLGNPTGGFWTISLNRPTGATAVVYTDAEASGGSDAWLFDSSVCIVNTY